MARILHTPHPRYQFFWGDQYCVIAVCLAWGGRLIVLAQTVLEHGSATVSFADYRSVLDAVVTLQQHPLAKIDWQGQRGLSFLQIGLRALQRLLYLRLPLPPLTPLPPINPPAAVASRKKKARLAQRIEFSRVTVFSF